MKICVDFDGTLFTDNFPLDGDPIWDTINWVKNRQANGDKIYLYTCRTDEAFSEAVEMCHAVGLDFDGFFGTKPIADIYLDDKAMHPRECKRKRAN